MRGRKKIERPDVIALAETGLTSSEIASKLGLKTGIVYAYLRSRGIAHRRGRPPRCDLQILAGMVARGMTHYEIADALGLHWKFIYDFARHNGILTPLKTRGRKAAPAPPQTVARAARMAEMYRNGCILETIGNEFGVSRERVRQVIKKHHALVGKDGGRSVMSEANRNTAQRKKSITYLQKYGCTVEEYRTLRDLGQEMLAAGFGIHRTPLRAYCTQKNNARSRGVGWRISLWEWWQVWQQSGKWESRGRGQGYVMCRRRDEGPYAVGNIFIAPATDNSSRRKGKTSGLPTGVSKRGRKFCADRNINGIKYHVGTFATAEAASIAYLTFNPSQRSAA